MFCFSSRRRHTRCALVTGSADVCSSDLGFLYAGVTFFYFVMFDVVRRAPRGVAKLLWLAPLAVAALAGGAVAKASTEAEDDPSMRQTANIAFVDKPNVYFLSFDAKIGRAHV